MLIYCAEFPNGKRYVGMTTGKFSIRISQHLSDTKNRMYTAFHRAIHKYGKDSITWYILEDGITSVSYLKERETFYILKLDTYKPKGYNLSLGGEGSLGYRHTDRAKAKIVAALKGRVCSKETRAKIGLANSIKRPSLEARRKMSLAKKGKPATAEVKARLLSYALRYKPSKEHKQALLRAHLGVPLTAAHRLKLSLAKDSRSCSYLLTSPDNMQHFVTDMYTFCRVHNLRKERMIEVCHKGYARKSHKGWTGFCYTNKVFDGDFKSPVEKSL